MFTLLSWRSSAKTDKGDSPHSAYWDCGPLECALDGSTKTGSSSAPLWKVISLISLSARCSSYSKRPSRQLIRFPVLQKRAYIYFRAVTFFAKLRLNKFQLSRNSNILPQNTHPPPQKLSTATTTFFSVYYQHSIRHQIICSHTRLFTTALLICISVQFSAASLGW